MEVLKQMLASKKFVATLIGVVITLVGKVGFDIDHETAAMIVGLVSAYVLGQGLADNGKAAASIEAAASEKAEGQ